MIVIDKINGLKELFKDSRYISDLEHDIENLIDIDNDSFDMVIEACEQYINENEIIYYYNAMKFLSANDASLGQSIGLAVDCGIDLTNVSSETLANLLNQELSRNELYSLQSDIQEILESE